MLQKLTQILTPCPDYRYPYTAAGGSGGGSAPGSNPQSEGSRPALVNLQNAPSATNQQPGAAPQQTGSSSSGVAGPSPSYQPNRFLVTYDSSSNKPFSAPEVPSQGAGIVSPTARPLPPAGTEKKSSSFSVQPPSSAAGTSGSSKVGSGGAPSGPVYSAPPVYPAPGNMAPTLDFGDGPVPYIGDPSLLYHAGSYANNYPASQGGHDTAATSGLNDAFVSYGGAPTSFCVICNIFWCVILMFSFYSTYVV